MDFEEPFQPFWARSRAILLFVGEQDVILQKYTGFIEKEHLS